MAAQFSDQQAAARVHLFGQLAQGLGRCGEVMQHHVQHHAVGARVSVLEGIGQVQLHIVQALLLAALAGEFEHRLAVVQGGHPGEAACQLRQEAPVTRANFQRAGVRWQIQRVEQGHYAVAVLRQAGDQVLLGLETLGAASEKVAAGGGPLLVYLGDTLAHLGGQQQAVDFLQQRGMQSAAGTLGMGQGAAVEDRIAFAARCHQAGLGQYLEVMAHPRLADGEDLRQFQHAERVIAQGAQNVQAQAIARGLAQGGQQVGGLEVECRRALGHGAQSSRSFFSQQPQYQKVLILRLGFSRWVFADHRRCRG